MTTPDLPMRERIAEVLAHARCRETNPKADHPRMGYRAFSEEQRAHLRAQQYDAADAVLAVLADLPDTAAEADARQLILENYLAGVLINHTRLEQLAAGQP